jgi:hypothetical protein
MFRMVQFSIIDLILNIVFSPYPLKNNHQIYSPMIIFYLHHQVHIYFVHYLFQQIISVIIYPVIFVLQMVVLYFLMKIFPIKQQRIYSDHPLRLHLLMRLFKPIRRNLSPVHNRHTMIKTKIHRMIPML